jgi:beta-glucosidase
MAMNVHQRASTLLISLLAASVCGVAAAQETAARNSATQQAPRQMATWQTRHAAFNERARQGDVDLLFIGDSITQQWETRGREVWAKRYGERKAMNLGIGGDQTQHVLWRLDNGNIDGIEPKVAVVMIGTNNSRANSAAEIGEGIAAIVAKLRAKLPETHVLLLAIFPRGERPSEMREKLAEASKTAAERFKEDEKVHYLDIGAKFVNSDGTISREIMPDFLHLSARGYELWAEAIEAKLAELLKSGARSSRSDIHRTFELRFSILSKPEEFLPLAAFAECGRINTTEEERS